jgi:hypothetical protein
MQRQSLPLCVESTCQMPNYVPGAAVNGIVLDAKSTATPPNSWEILTNLGKRF